ncbi:hypothetical protein CAPTEDRAFT_187011 [Capitella teleta]|uniref:G-protein coupled receptors family 1 profile domain-containing protein n=1 Tax=Capitella teleta TaxID=283909 RepID=R7UVV3_CAPTE|nr:hypothetical protein CAPTEDRAFT_187011 [Capitella teleta]|eukprot:ELU10748.1 hypothetical protein CAPTEDRAFT_187011 [Capitella teleta]
MALISEPATMSWEVSTSISQESDGLSADSICTYYKFSISVVVMGSLCIFGIAGNLLSLATLRVLHRASGSTGSSVILLITLSTCDLLLLAAFLILKVSISFCAYKNLCTGYYTPYFWISLYGWPTLSMLHCLTTWVTVLLTVHRYIAVCHPLKAKSWTRTSSLKYQIPLVVVAAIVYTTPGYLDYEAMQVVTEWGLTNQRVLTWLGANYWYQLMYKTICFFIFIYFIPGFILLILGAFLVQSITKAERIRSTMSGFKSGTSSAADDMTRIMISIVAVHLLTQPWEPLRTLMAEKFEMSITCGSFLFYFEEIPSLMAIINSTMNFVVYCFVGTRFRRACKQLCTGRRQTPLKFTESSSCQSENSK